MKKIVSAALGALLAVSANFSLSAAAAVSDEPPHLPLLMASESISLTFARRELPTDPAFIYSPPAQIPGKSIIMLPAADEITFINEHVQRIIDEEHPKALTLWLPLASIEDGLRLTLNAPELQQLDLYIATDFAGDEAYKAAKDWYQEIREAKKALGFNFTREEYMPPKRADNPVKKLAYNLQQLLGLASLPSVKATRLYLTHPYYQLYELDRDTVVFDGLYITGDPHAFVWIDINNKCHFKHYALLFTSPGGLPYGEVQVLDLSSKPHPIVVK